MELLMLIYHPLHDSSHCTYRMLCILHDLEQEEVPWDLLRILDFYVLFPHFLSTISLPEDLRAVKSTFRKIKPPYEHLPPKARLMFELGRIQDQTIKSLTAKGITEKGPYTLGRIKVREPLIPKEVIQLIAGEKFRNTAWYKVLIGDVSKVSLKGERGLKDRSGLMEYKYDVV